MVGKVFERTVSGPGLFKGFSSFVVVLHLELSSTPYLSEVNM